MGLFDQCFAHLGVPQEPQLTFKVDRHEFPGGKGELMAPDLTCIQPLTQIGEARFDLIERAQELTKEQKGQDD